MRTRMMALSALAAAALLLPFPLGAQDMPEELATRRAEAWLALVDQGKYEEIKSRKQTKTLPGGPDGSYVVILYDTSFENKKEAVETVTPMLDPDGIWRVSGYYIQ